MEELKISTKKFLSAFFSEDEVVNFRALANKKDPNFEGKKYSSKLSEFDKLVPKLKKINSEGKGIYFVVNSGGHDHTKINRINAQFVESDTLPIDEQYENLMNFPLKPSIIVKTQKSLHSYWLINNGDIYRFGDIQKQLVAYFNGDPRNVDLPRVFRLPNFYHMKYDPVMVTCIKFNPELRYTQDELVQHLPELLIKPIVKKKVVDKKETIELSNEQGLKRVLDRCDFIKNCNDKAINLPEFQWYSMITNLAVFEGGNQVIHEFSKEYPTYDYNETENKIQHFLSSGTGPINCSTISEDGFKCPKFLNNECGCKSPAGLAYMPLSIDELCKELSEVQFNRNKAKDAEVAEKFIIKNMYNISEVTAEAFISSNIKDYFGFTNGDIKLLLKSFREANAKYKKSKVVETCEADEIPVWYEYTKNGMKFKPGVLARHLSENSSTFFVAQSFFNYENGVYKQIDELQACKLVKSNLIDDYSTMNNILDSIGQWKIDIGKNINELNPNPFIINFKNGLYDVKNESLSEHSEDYISTVQIQANYNLEAKCPKFIKFLERSIDPEDILTIQELLGYLLIPVNRGRKAFLIVGPAHSGKSTLLAVIQEVLLGKENVSNIEWQCLSDRFKTAELFNKLANVFADLPTTIIENNSMFKSITGDDYITGEKKNKDPFSFKPFARLIFSCNEIPHSYSDRTNAFYSRLHIIRFIETIPEKERDAHLIEKIKDEVDGIVAWALEGLSRLIKEKYEFTESKKSKLAVEAYKQECSSVLSFVEECCVLTESSTTELSRLFECYCNYVDASKLKPVSKIRFNKELKDKIANISESQDSYNRRKVINGIGLMVR